MIPRRRRTLWRRVVAVVLVLAGAVVTGCAVPTDESATALDPETLPEELQPGFTAPTTTVPPEEDQRTFEIYLLDRATERTQVVPRDRELARDSELTDVVETLFVGADDEEREELNLSSRLAEGVYALGGDVEVEDGVAHVDITVLDTDGELAEEQFIAAEPLRDIAAQLLFTVTAFSDDITALRVSVGGEDASLPTIEGDTEPGEAVDTDDFRNYLPSFVPESTTTSTTSPTTTTSTTVPATEGAPAP